MNLQKSCDLLARDQAVLARGQHLLYYPLAVDRVDGEIVTDLDGNRYLDFMASASSLNLGGADVHVMEAVRAQLEKCLQYCTCYTTNQPMVEYAERLASIYPGKIPVKVLFAHSGSDACDTAVRLIRTCTGRKRFISFLHSCHGSSYAGASLSACFDGGSEQVSLMLPDIRYFRCYYEDEGLPADYHYLREIEEAFRTDFPPEEVAAVFVEPTQGDGGLRPASHAFLRQLYALCKKHGILFISDEVQQGFFRSGRWFGIEEYGIIPDGILLGKSLGGGLPLGAFLARPEIMDVLPFSICAHTISGFHLACAAGIAQFDFMCQPEFQTALRENCTGMEQCVKTLVSRKRQGILLKAYGTGMSYGIHVLRGGTGDPATAAKIACRSFEKGLLLLVVSGNVLRLQPPLTIRPESLREGFRRLEEAIDEVLAGYEPDPLLLSQPAWQGQSDNV